MPKYGDYVEDSAPATGDVVIYKDVSATETNRITLLDLWKAFVGFLSSFTAAGTLDGTELIAVSQGGNPRKTTLTDVVALAGGGGGTPGGSDTQLQRNNAGAFGGISGATSDGTNVTFGSGNLRATSPRVTTDISDSNGNELIKVTATGSAVNEFTVTNAATGGSPTLSATGGDTNIDLTLTAKGSGVVKTAGIFQAGSGHPNGFQYDANTLIYGAGGNVTFYLSSGNAVRASVDGLKVSSGGRFAFSTSTDASQAAGVYWSIGSGSPEGVVTAAVGSLYSRTNGGAGTTLYVKESGAGNTGWVAK